MRLLLRQKASGDPRSRHDDNAVGSRLTEEILDLNQPPASGLTILLGRLDNDRRSCNPGFGNQWLPAGQLPINFNRS